MTNPLPAAEAAAKAEELTYGVDTPASAESVRFHKYWSFMHGHAWTLQHLSEQGAGFDEAAARDQGSVQCSIGPLQFDGFMRGARYQHAQSQAVIAGLREEKVELERQLNNQNSDLARNFGRMVQENKLQQKEIAALKAELAEAREIVEAGCYIGSFDCDQQLGLQERCERFMRCWKSSDKP